MLNTAYNINSIKEDVELKNTLIEYRKRAIPHDSSHEKYSDYLYPQDLISMEILIENDKYKERMEIEEREKIKRENKRTRFFEEKSKNILLENKKRLEEGFDVLTPLEKFEIHKESLLFIQEIFYRVMERNPKLFNISTLLSLRKRRLKNAVGSENDLHYPIKFKDPSNIKKKDPEIELYNSKMVRELIKIFKIFLIKDNLILFLVDRKEHRPHYKKK